MSAEYDHDIVNVINRTNDGNQEERVDFAPKPITDSGGYYNKRNDDEIVYQINAMDITTNHTRNDDDIINVINRTNYS